MSSFTIWMHSLSLPCLISLARTSITMLNRSVRLGTLILILNLAESFQTFTIENGTNCGLVIYVLYSYEVYLFYTHLVEMIIFLIFHSINVVYHIY